MGAFRNGLLFVFAAVCLGSCAARDVTPVHMAQPGDEDLDCAALQQQIAANDAAAADLLHKDKQVGQANAAKVAGSAIPGLGLLLAASIDLSNEEQIRARALIDRDEQLKYLAARKRCPTTEEQRK